MDGPLWGQVSDLSSREKPGSFRGSKAVEVQQHQLLTALYAAFNARDIDRCLAGMQPDVIWANGMEGGSVHGHEGVREYWTRQWKLVDPHVDPQGFQTDGNKVTVDVHQVVRDMDGSLIADQMVKHVFTIENGLAMIFEID
jgi:limonene-1,2-epoxide hydrolase